MVVDDEPINLQVLSNQLSSQDYSVSQAMNGQQALDYVATIKPDLILLDVMMPKMSGYEVCEKLRLHYPSNVLPILFLTAKNLVTDLVLGFQYGANDYLPKPFEKQELLVRVKTHLKLSQMNIAYGRFVPHEFLRLLDKDSIVDVHLGEHRQIEMSILFADIRQFTALSEQMTPKENFEFLNAYLARMEPQVRRYQGFIDKYIGDAIMALFRSAVDDALQAAIAMMVELNELNKKRAAKDQVAIKIGIGINTGPLILGTIGGPDRMEGTVISDAVNLAARVESMNKEYGTSILMTEEAMQCLKQPDRFEFRFVDQVCAKGNSYPSRIYEVFNADSMVLREGKKHTLRLFHQAVLTYFEADYEKALSLFQLCIKECEHDSVSELYIDRCLKAISLIAHEQPKLA